MKNVLCSYHNAFTRKKCRCFLLNAIFIGMNRRTCQHYRGQAERRKGPFCLFKKRIIKRLCFSVQCDHRFGWFRLTSRMLRNISSGGNGHNCQQQSGLNDQVSYHDGCCCVVLWMVLNYNRFFRVDTSKLRHRLLFSTCCGADVPVDRIFLHFGQSTRKTPRQ